MVEKCPGLLVLRITSRKISKAVLFFHSLYLIIRPWPFNDSLDIKHKQSVTKESPVGESSAAFYGKKQKQNIIFS